MSPVIEKSFYFKIRLKKYFLSMLTALPSPWGIQNLFQKMSNPDSISTVRYCMCVMYKPKKHCRKYVTDQQKDSVALLY